MVKCDKCKKEIEGVYQKLPMPDNKEYILCIDCSLELRDDINRSVILLKQELEQKKKDNA